MKVIITGSGSYIPTKVRKNETFEGNEFYNPDGSLIETAGQLVVDKFREITGIEERRYLKEDLVTSDMAFFARSEERRVGKECRSWSARRHWMTQHGNRMRR